ncbi:exodeoxyribonuclease V subunit beta [Endozoicomonas sp. G2_1]|uniref:exodeoxyribonuclease V subunit beta n=1 Tax=Endozoicomonas sp. G2_1 TaxID=2821091 RepID=UPI001ADC330D|nr:exodeoxyribonuclease V subunit beta [Endozoicomonas sp. G2_1]MBO9490669.1 exodeoxyribonuclease V subunit beta [Endozoicomonas sp. G2_1]
MIASALSAQQLVAQDIPLTGSHLIEASAGTGKTYNITRLYLRLLLERELTVEQILVMTFTNDATEELRGRIDSTIREVLLNWSKLSQEDSFFIAIAERVDTDKVHILLKQALVNIDQAAIFTIHGFCKRVLSQYAFQSSLPFDVNLESDCPELLVAGCQDWYRLIAKQAVDDFLALIEFWPTPESFLQHFGKAINKHAVLSVKSVDVVKQEFTHLIAACSADLAAYDALLTEALIDSKKGADRDKRKQELENLKLWLSDCGSNIDLLSTSAMPDAFVDGRRYSRSKYKAELVEAFNHLNQLKKIAKSYDSSIAKASAFAIVVKGIEQIRQSVKQAKQSQSRLDFDDLISLLAEQVTIDSQLADMLASQYPVALVDEFQDTDQQQFDILSALYLRNFKQAELAQVQSPLSKSDNALFMIGDPKQAIYGFRGGDVFTYLAARDQCQYQWLMDTNWRSTAQMIAGYNRLFYGQPLGNRDSAVDVFGYGIDYQPVKPSPKALLSAGNSEFTDDGADHYKALQFVDFCPELSAAKSSTKTTKVKQSFRRQMALWCASEIKRLLSVNTLQASGQHQEKVQAKDIAILVRDGGEAAQISQALSDYDLASVYLSNKSNLYHSSEAKLLWQILSGIWFVERDSLFTAALANQLLGFDGEKLYQLQQDELAWQRKKFAFIDLRSHWQQKGFISMALSLMHEHFNVQQHGKDRTLTNILHLFELLQAASQRYRQPQELLYWFEQQINATVADRETELRLESDANLIKIVTQHGSKGLEYPVVFVPFATRHKDPTRIGNRLLNYLEYHDSDGKLKVCLDGDTNARQLMSAEAYAESIRLLYVAITRAEKRCYILTADFDQAELSPLGQTLNWQPGTDISVSLQNLAAEQSDAIGYCKIDQIALDNLTETHAASKLQTGELVAQSSDSAQYYQVAQFTGHIERDWWLSSFSALTRHVSHSGVSNPDRDSESILIELQQNPESQQLRFELAKGAPTGNLLHGILEHCRFDQPDWQDVITKPLQRFGELPAGFEQTDLVAWLTQVLSAPLVISVNDKAPDGEISQESKLDSTHAQNLPTKHISSFSLADLKPAKTLRESEFYFPMVEAQMADLAHLLAKHRGCKVEQIKLPFYRQLKGMMHGFIDLVFETNGKYYVCDYKSSHLGDDYHSYMPEQLSQHIESNYYDLQYLIYSLALHRQLSLTLEDYQPSRDFGGVYYLYLRGMNKTELGSGVYYRAIEPSELIQLDKLFSAGHDNASEELL